MRFILTTALGMLLFAASPLPAGDLYTGGRLFDNWYAEIDADFVPDNPDTPELDGRGGPNGNGTLPHPDTLWQLSTQSPKGFVMNTGGDAERGRRFYAAQCAYCHGDDATAILFDDGTQSLGQHSRYYGYAIAMKALSGDPGSDMGPQLPAWLSPAEQSQLLLDLVAALCDRERFGVGAATEPDVPDGDPRCGAYLR